MGSSHSKKRYVAFGGIILLGDELGEIVFIAYSNGMKLIVM
jgi:hypothetical protein